MSQTLTGPVTLEREIKRSRFVAHAAPADDEEIARGFLEHIGDPTATHNCWAFRAGDQYRFDDDGEPGGTAGRPILQAIEGQGFDRVVVVVTRYFGGIKLGTGGLARAYGGTAAELLRTAGSTPIVAMVRLRLALPFEYAEAAHRALAEFGGEKFDEDYASDGVTLIATVPAAQRQAFAEHLRNLARGQVRIARI